MLLKSISRFFGWIPKPVIELNQDKAGDGCLQVLNCVSSCRTQEQFDSALRMATLYEKQYAFTPYHLGLIRDVIFDTELRLALTTPTKV